MSDPVIVAIITGVVTLTGNILANFMQHRKAAIEQARRDQKLDDHIAALDKKVTSHNAYAEKFSAMTSAIVTIQKDIEWMKKTGEK